MMLRFTHAYVVDCSTSFRPSGVRNYQLTWFRGCEMNSLTRVPKSRQTVTSFSNRWIVIFLKRLITSWNQSFIVIIDMFSGCLKKGCLFDQTYLTSVFFLFHLSFRLMCFFLQVHLYVNNNRVIPPPQSWRRWRSSARTCATPTS